MRIGNVGACVLALLVMACGGNPGTTTPPEAEAGQLQLPLISTDPDGQSYRLVGATFTITGPQNQTITDTSADTVVVPLSAGLYTVELGGTWHLERTNAPGQPVQAQLVSPNPMAFSVGVGQTRVVRFLFKIPGNGNADLGFTVDSGGWFTGTLDFTNAPPQDGNLFSELAGKTVPFTISFQSATFIKEQDFNKALRVETGPITIQFGGAPSALLQERVIPALETDSQFLFRLMAVGNGEIVFTGFDLPGMSEPFRWRLYEGMPFAGALDAEGYPRPQPFQFNVPSDLMFFGNTPGHIQGPATGSARPQ